MCIFPCNAKKNPSRNEPDLEFEGLLKRNSTCVEFFQGTMFNSVDLERVKLRNKKFLLYIFMHALPVLDIGGTFF
ncbi:hypothetical protein Avbf_00295 [Armadillidium vulgare]|nr:hypothetical protein Avbf_00295 [Armadillidium vulgare]